MEEIKCPRCGEVFQVDDSGYAKIAQQVRDKEFKAELQRREKEIAEKSENNLQLMKTQVLVSDEIAAPFECWEKVGY